MTCLEVRERLTEYALGLLTKVDASEVERHLEWCAGCRKESAELEEGAARMALALPVTEPAGSLETRVVDRLRVASGKIVPGGRRRVRVLLASTLAAALLAVGAMGWAIAERWHVESLQATVVAKQAQLNRFARIVEGVKGRGKTFTASLAPPLGEAGGGLAVISSAPNVTNFVFIDVLVPGAKGPLWFQLVDDKSALRAVRLGKGPDGNWIRHWRTPQDLSGTVSITIMDGDSRTVLSGTVKPYAAEPSSPAN